MSFGFRDCFGFLHRTPYGGYSDFEFILASLEVLSWSPKLRSSPTVLTPKNRPARTCKRFLRFALSLCSFVPQCLCGYESIMQNKPNLQDSQMVVNLAKTSNYNNEQRTMNYELLFKTNPIKPNCRPTTPFSKFLSKTPKF